MSSYDDISPTAMKHAYLRALNGVPNAPEIWEVLKSHYHGLSDAMFGNAGRLDFSKVRYETTSEFLDKSGVDQIIEFASGWSPRGLNFSIANPSGIFVEVELAQIAEIKKKCFLQIDKMPANLHIISGSALDDEIFKKASSYLIPQKPVAIINEGFMVYLDFQEKSQFAKLVHGILTEFGGIWLTPDFMLQPPSHTVHSGYNDSSNEYKTPPKQHPTRNPQNQFVDIAHVESFLDEHGFKCTIRDQRMTTGAGHQVYVEIEIKG